MPDKITWTNEKRSGIYSICNTINGKIYIGSSSDLQKRKYDHFNKLKAGKHTSKYLQRSYDKYGKEYFLFNVILICEISELKIYEQACIDVFKPEYNSRIVAESNRGMKLSIETREKMSIARKGNPLVIEINRKIGERRRGKYHISDEHKNSISLSHTGKPLSEDHKMKLSKSHKGKGHPVSEETKERIRLSLMGHSVSQESILKNKNSHIGKIASEETKQKMRKPHKRRIIDASNSVEK
jgi:group I intron endonuclease